MTEQNNLGGDTRTRRRNTPQKQLILDTLIGLGSHVSAGEIYREISKTNPELGRATVFRVLSDMAEDGILLRVNTTRGECKFDITARPHCHVICRKCGKVADVSFDGEVDVLSRVVSASGYSIDGAFIELSGVCPSCRENEDDSKE